MMEFNEMVQYTTGCMLKEIYPDKFYKLTNFGEMEKGCCF